MPPIPFYKRCLAAACIFFAILLISGCAGFYNNAYSPVTHRAWERYTAASPFAYDTPYTEVMLERLRDDMRAIPLDGVEDAARRHILNTIRWCERFPPYHRRAVAAYEEEYRRVKRYSRLSTRAGGRIGSSMADRDAYFDRLFFGGMGAIIGWSLNEGYAQSSAAAAARRIMRPHAAEGRLLVLDEYQLNNRLGHASTYYLRNTVSSLGRY